MNWAAGQPTIAHRCWSAAPQGEEVQGSRKMEGRACCGQYNWRIVVHDVDP